MIRKAVCALAVLAVAAYCVAQAEEITRVVITKIGDGKVTYAKFNRKDKTLTDEKTLTLAKDVKILNSKFNRETKKLEAGEPLSEGLNNDILKNIGKRGVRATLITNADGQVTQILIAPPFKRRKKDN
jgi:hypothetical protein